MITTVQQKGFAAIMLLVVVSLLPELLRAQAINSKLALDEVALEQYYRPMDVPRLALVVGAEHYENLATVPNALNDAREVARELVQLGFSFVRFVPDPKDDNEIYDYIKELAQRAGDEGSQPVIVFFFFAGHGFQDDNTNYIVPLNAKQKVRDYSVPVTTILHDLATHDQGLAIFVFDSCRDVLRSEGRGFANQAAPTRAVVDLAAGYDHTASSGLDADAVNSPYTATLLYFIKQEGMALTVMFGKVGDHVYEITKKVQDPQVPEMIGAGKNGYGFFFKPGPKVLTDERDLWKAALKTNQVTCIRNYLNAHPGSLYLGDALNWLADPTHPDTGSDMLGICPED